MQGKGEGHSSIAAYGRLEDIASALEDLTYRCTTNDFSGVDKILISLVDASGLSVSRVVKVEIEANSPPTITRVNGLALLPTNPHMDEDTDLLLDSIEVSVPGSSPNPTVQVEIYAANGMVDIKTSNNSDGLSISKDTRAGVVVAGEVGPVNRALRSLRYTPEVDFWGADEVSIAARQGISGEGGGWHAATAIETVIVMIGPINDPPRIDFPDDLMGDVLPVASAGELLPLAGITVHDPDAGEPAGSELVSVDISAGDGGNLLSLALSTATLHGRIPGVHFDEGSAEGSYPRIAFSAPIDIANGVLGLLQFFAPFGQESGLNDVTFTISDLGNWGYGDEEEVVSSVVTVAVQHRQDPFAVAKEPIEWDVPLDTLAMEEDGRLDNLGIALIPDGDKFFDTTWVEATVSADNGMMQLATDIGDTNIVHHGLGSMSLSGTLSDVSSAMTSWAYLPKPDYSGMEVLELSVHGRTYDWVANASVSILVRSTPDLPSITIANPSSSNMQDARVVEVGSRLKLYGIVVQHVDALSAHSGQTLTMTAFSSAGNGTLAMDTQPGLWIYREENRAGALVARGALENLQVALDSGALEYWPLDGYDGVDTVVVSVSVDSLYNPFDDDNNSSARELLYSQNVEAALDVTVIPSMIPPAIVFEDDALFRADEGGSVELSGIRAQAPGRRNTSEEVVTVTFEAEGGGVTLPAAHSRQVSTDGQGQSVLSITGTEREVNMALSGAVFKGAPFYNGVAAVKVRRPNLGS